MIEKESEGAQHALESMADNAIPFVRKETWSRKGLMGRKNRTGGDWGLKVMRMKVRLGNSEWIICEEWQSGLEAENAEMWLGLKVKVTQSCPTLCNPMDYTVHGILQVRILEWAAIPYSRGSSQPRDWTQVSYIAGGFFTRWATREAQNISAEISPSYSFIINKLSCQL